MLQKYKKYIKCFEGNKNGSNFYIDCFITGCHGDPLCSNVSIDLNKEFICEVYKGGGGNSILIMN